MFAFSAETRRSALERMAEAPLDILVIGGGISGAGIALDAAARGFSTALVERDDFASGTSGRSSRMVHGGVRYVPQGDLALVHDALRERATILRLAPHVARPLPMYLLAPGWWSRAGWRLGVTVYDALAAGRNIRRHHVAGAAEVARAIPGLEPQVPAVVYHECRADDARLTLEVARTAALHGALVANHADVTGLLGDGSVRGARVVDRVTGEAFEVRARLTVNAAGVWADRVQAMATEAPRRLRPSKGVHVVFRAGAVPTRVAVVLPSAAHDGRFVFGVPWEGRVYAGTTDTDHQGDLDHPEATEADLDYVVGALAAAFPGLSRADVTASWAGLRPLLDRRGGPGENRLGRATADLSRRHAVYGGPPGLLTVTGGKLTTYRAMAEDVVDRAGRTLGRRVRCRTATIPLGFGLGHELAAELARAVAAAGALGLPPEAGRRMVERYGDDWPEALRMIEADRSLGEPVAGTLPVLKVEVELARSREMALTHDDVVVRRTRLSTLDPQAAHLSTA